MRALQTLALAAFLIPTHGLAQQEPAFELKGLQLGASRQMALEVFPEMSVCDQDQCTVTAERRGRVQCGVIPSDRSPSGLEKYSECLKRAADSLNLGASSVTGYTLLFRSDKLASMSVSMDSSQFGVVTAALREKYGPPSSDKSTGVLNAKGVRHTMRRLEWSRSRVATLVAVDGMFNPDVARVSMTTAAEIGRQQAEMLRNSDVDLSQRYK